MLRINPEGVTVIAYDINKDTLLVRDNCRWGKVAFVVVRLVLHYSLFPSSDLSDMGLDCCCGYRTALGTPNWVMCCT